MPGRGTGWTADLLVADAEELKEHTASEVDVSRFKEKEVGIPKVEKSSHFPVLTVQSMKFKEDGPNRHTTNPSRSDSNLVEDVSIRSYSET